MAGDKARLIEIIAEKSLLDSGSFRLASGVDSGYYFDMKPTALDPEGANLVAEQILAAIAGETVDAIGGLALGAVPVVAAIVQKSAASGRPIPGFYVRKEQKECGAERLIDGNLAPGSTVVIVEDVTTTGGSVMKAVAAVREFGCSVDTVVTIVDRLEGAEANLAEHGLRLIALTNRDDYAA